MRPDTPSTMRVEFPVVLLLFSICAYVVAPFSFGDKHLRVPQRGELDSRQQVLLMSDSMDKLFTDPQSFYDTEILYPDRNQLRSLEPILGYAVLGLPLRTILRLNDVDVFEALRWVIIFTCLFYAYLLFRAIGIDFAMSVAGAVLCLFQPLLVIEIGRLNILCIPLILPVVYHAVMVWTSGRLRHSVGLFVFAALYPLCGMVNSALSAIAALFVLPLLLRMLAAQRRDRRLMAFLLPILAAGLLDGVVLSPWLLGRSDLAVYISDAFLQIKHWNPTPAPGVRDLVGFAIGRIGPGLTAAVATLCVFIPLRHFDRPVKGGLRQAALPGPPLAYLWVACVVALGLSMSSYHSGGPALPWLQLVFHAVCYTTLLLYLAGQIRIVLSNDQTGIRNSVLMLSAGVGVYLCLMSFGPVYVSNDNPLANHIMRILLDVLPPLRGVREFSRLWIFGILFLSIYVTIRLALALSLSSQITRMGAAVVIVAAAMLSLYNRQLMTSADIEVPRDLFELASHSRGTGGVYVHPDMKWNTETGVWMISLAKVLGRPIVNGYLGLAPPWFTYASNVLRRFPDPESLWLLRKWQVDTVVSYEHVQVDESAGVKNAFANSNGVLYEVAALPDDIPHPSENDCVASAGRVRIEAELPKAVSGEGGASMTLATPQGFSVTGVEILFRPSVVEQIPTSIGVFAVEGRARLNQDHSGDWIESLAANALLRRRSPMATIRLQEPQRGELRVEFRKPERQPDTDQSSYADWWFLSPPPIERMALCGAWTR